MRVLAEIPARPSTDLRTGTLRRGDLEAFDRLLEELSGSRTVLTTGAGAVRREVAVGLATTAAVAGRRAALLECDLVEPWLADALGLANAPGLREYLDGEARAEDILKPAMLAGPGSGGATGPLVCVVAGRASAEGPRLLGSPALAEALVGLREAYELVVLLGPAVGDERSLGPLLGQADAALGCCGPSEPWDLPISITGLVIQA